MLNKKSLPLLITGTIILLSSCTKHITTSRFVNNDVAPISTRPLMLNLDVNLNKKINGKATKIGLFNSVEEAKESARWDAVTTNSADVIVAPIYSIKKSLFFIEAKVTGLYGVYTSIETIDKKDEYEEMFYIDSTKSNRAKGGVSKPSGGVPFPLSIFIKK